MHEHLLDYRRTPKNYRHRSYLDRVQIRTALYRRMIRVLKLLTKVQQTSPGSTFAPRSQDMIALRLSGGFFLWRLSSLPVMCFPLLPNVTAGHSVLPVMNLTLELGPSDHSLPRSPSSMIYPLRVTPYMTLLDTAKM